MNEASQYRVQILADGGAELDALMSIGGTFTRREIDAAVEQCRDDGKAMRRLQRNLARLRQRENQGAAA